jgi:LytTr DNA-binding domain
METILIPARYYDYHHRLPFEWAQVLRLDGSLNYTVFTLTDGRKHISTKTIGVYDQCLPEGFVRVDKGCIINLAFLAEFSKKNKTVYLTDGSHSKVARRRVKQLAESIQPPPLRRSDPDGDFHQTKKAPLPLRRSDSEGELSVFLGINILVRKP